MKQGLEITIVVKEENHGQRENTGDDSLIPVALPEMTMSEREDRNAQQQEDKKRYAPEWQNVSQGFHRSPTKDITDPLPIVNSET
jgi:hypothetical protein